MKKKLTAIFLLLSIKNLLAQDSLSTNTQKDLLDVYHSIFKTKTANNFDSKKHKKYQLAILPAVGYSLQTGWAGLVTANIGFKTSNLNFQKQSSINTSITYSQYNQIIFPFQANIWSKANKINYVTDFRFVKYPSDIYGLGGRVDPNQGYTINFSGIKIHQSIQKEIVKNIALGLGFYYDNFWNITALDSLKQNIAYRLSHKLQTAERAVGIAFKATYDSRLNQINAKQGLYTNIVFRPNFTFLGSEENWNTLQTDVRYYLPFPKTSKNIIAFWNYNVLTLGNNTAPYLMLASTGWDDTYNTGRGYVQGRFRGKNMYYFETEYRINVTKSDLLNAVIFCNAQKFSGDLSRSYIQPKIGYGAGLRIKLNKYSNTNICLDYGFGENGSKGLFVNIGEIF